MNHSARIAVVRYAAAYDQLSQTAAQAAVSAEQLAQAAQALAPAQAVLTNPCVAVSAKKELVQQALAAQPQVANFLCVLLDAKRYALLPEIVQQVQALLDKRNGILRARVCSAQVLSQSQQQQAQEALSLRYGTPVKAAFDTDPTLLGGLKIWCNGELIDGSLQGQLGRLQEELIK